MTSTKARRPRPDHSLANLLQAILWISAQTERFNVTAFAKALDMSVHHAGTLLDSAVEAGVCTTEHFTTRSAVTFERCYLLTPKINLSRPSLASAPHLGALMPQFIKENAHENDQAAQR